MNENLENISEIKLSYHPKFKMSERPKVQSSKDSSEILRRFFDINTFYLQESFKVMYISRSNRIVGIKNHSIGSAVGTVVDIKNIMSAAILSNCAGIIICHQHPSGNPRPSQEDINITKQIKEACRILDIILFDHIILTDETYTSFVDEGLL